MKFQSSLIIKRGSDFVNEIFNTDPVKAVDVEGKK